MTGYGLRVYKQSFLEDEKQKLLMEEEARITELKQHLRLNGELNKKIQEEIDRRAENCLKLKESMSPEGNLGA